MSRCLLVTLALLGGAPWLAAGRRAAQAGASSAEVAVGAPGAAAFALGRRALARAAIAKAGVGKVAARGVAPGVARALAGQRRELSSKWVGAAAVHEDFSAGRPHLYDSTQFHPTLRAPMSVEDVQERLELLRAGVNMPWLLRHEYVELAQEIADFAPTAFKRYLEHGAGLDNWIAIQMQEVERQSMATVALFRGGLKCTVDDLQRSAIDTWRALADPLEKLHAEEVMWITRSHLDAHTVSPICQEACRRLESVIHTTDDIEKVKAVAAMLQQEVTSDRDGRPFSKQEWETRMTDAVTALCPGE